MNTTAHLSTLAPDEITRRGQDIYLQELKETLEKSRWGDYVVIEVTTKKYFLDSDPVVAVQKAKKEFPDSLFFIVHIGTLQASAVKQRKEPYAWLF